MALEAKRKAVNDNAILYLAALDDLFDGLTQGEKVYFLPVKEARGAASTANPPTPLTDVSRHTRLHVIAGQTTSNGSNRYALGGNLVAQVLGYVPWCVFCTNDAGELA